MGTHSSILAWEIHGRRSLAGYSPWSRKESDTTEQLTFSPFTFIDFSMPRKHLKRYKGSFEPVLSLQQGTGIGDMFCSSVHNPLLYNLIFLL